MIRKILPALVVLVSTLTMPVADSVLAMDGPVTLRSLGTNDTDVRGMYGSTSFFVAVAPGTAISGPVGLEVEFSHSELLLPEVSTMTVRVNGVSLASTFLTPANRDRGRLVVPVPREVIGEGLFVEARFYMRLSRDACEEPTNPALWATVHGASTVTLPTAYAGPRDLSDVPNLLIPASEAVKPLTIVVPDSPNATMLRAAGVTAAVAGRWLGAAGRDAVVATASEAPDDAPSIQLGAGLDVPDVVVSGATRGVIAVDQTGPVRLVLTGADESAVLAAARALRDVHRFSGPAVVLTGKRFAADPKESAPWTAGAASFHQLGIDRLDAAGPGTKVFDFVVSRPPGWKPQRTGRIELVLDTAPGVRRGPSFVQATINGFDLGSLELRPGGGPRRYGFDVSGALIDRDLRGRPLRALRLQLRVHLTPQQRTCTPLDAAAITASVLTTSTITLPHESGGGYDLGRFPASIGDPVIAIADGSDDAVAAGVQAAASVGRWQTRPFREAVHLAVAAEIDRPQRRRNLILLGDADTKLGRRIDIGRRPAGAGPESVVAYAGLVKSPYAARSTILVVHGSAPGIVATMRAFGSLDAVESIGGSRVAVLTDSPRTQTLQATRGAAPPVELAPMLEERRLRSETIIGGVLIVAFVAALVLLIRFRWRSPRP